MAHDAQALNDSIPTGGPAAGGATAPRVLVHRPEAAFTAAGDAPASSAPVGALFGAPIAAHGFAS